MKDQELIDTSTGPVSGVTAMVASGRERTVADRPGSGSTRELRGGARAAGSFEEAMVIDDRARLTPSQMVENKLVTLLRGSTLPVSHLQSRSFGRGRAQS